jgi:hypothetical protein
MEDAMDLNLDIGVVRVIGAVFLILGVYGWWYLVNKMKTK